jgi:hypothetical protein
MQPTLFPICACGALAWCSGLCRHCYWQAANDRARFGGKRVLVAGRDRICRGCGGPIEVVHHREDDTVDEGLMAGLCRACHSTAHHLRRVKRYLPPGLLELWREQHPDEPAQEQLDLAPRRRAVTIGSLKRGS